jgi:ABC-type branched-subunit amino acid transport system substrate-binding protein
VGERRGTKALVAAAALVLSACSSGSPDPKATSPISTRSIAPVLVKVAYFQDSTIDEPYQHELPALQGLRLAITQAVSDGRLPLDVEIEDLDTKGDPATALDLARDVAADPTYVAVVVAPFWSEPDAVGQVLDEAGLPTLGLSSLGATTDAWSGRRRLVPVQALEVKSLASYLRSRATAPLCLAGDGSALGVGLAHDLSAALGPRIAFEATVTTDGASLVDAVARVRDAGCGTVAWAGSATAAAGLRVAMTQAGLDTVDLVGSDATKTDTFLTIAGPAGDGTVVSCPCADLSTSTALRAQIFVHDYQSEFGTPPAPFAVEGWDAGGMLVNAMISAGSSRADVRKAIDATSQYAGLANDYVFGSNGELTKGSAHVAFWVDRGQRWAAPRWTERGPGVPRP